jgi:hypothetical protein
MRCRKLLHDLGPARIGQNHVADDQIFPQTGLFDELGACASILRFENRIAVSAKRATDQSA